MSRRTRQQASMSALTSLAAPSRSRKRGSSPFDHELSLSAHGLTSRPSKRQKGASGAKIPLQTTSRYSPNSGTLKEDEHLVILGETPDDSYTPDEDEDDEVPIRSLDGFVIYDRNSLEFISPHKLLVSSLPQGRYGAAGFVQAYITPDSEEEDDGDERTAQPKPGPGVHSRQFVQLSPILKLNYHYYDERKLCFDPNIYILTDHAWYILIEPSCQYSTIYSDFFINNKLLHQVLSKSLLDPSCTRPDFSLVLADLRKKKHSASKYLNHPLTVNDLDSHTFLAYLTAVLDAVLEQLPTNVCRKIRSTPLIRSLLINPSPDMEDDSAASFVADTETEEDSEHYSTDEESESEHTDSEASERSTIRSGSSSPSPSKPKSANAASMVQTVVTPVVGRIAGNVYNGHQLAIAGEADADEAPQGVAFTKESATHLFDPETVEWKNMIQEVDGVTYYGGVVLDGVEYLVGDTLIVVPGSDNNKPRANNHESDAAQSTNLYGSSYWFCRACYFFEESGGQFMHCQWFVHGCKTMLQETAHSQSLYMTNECDSILLGSIYKKCEVRTLVPDEDEPLEGYENSHSTAFHCGLIWDEVNTDFIDLPCFEQVETVTSLMPSYKPCYSCGLQRQQDMHRELRRIPHGFSCLGIRYHINEFVYLRPHRQDDSLLRIGQIVNIKGVPSKPKITVRLLERFCDKDRLYSNGKLAKPTSGLVKDNRCLVLTYHTVCIDPDDFEGTCFVKYLVDTTEIELWVKHDDHFYFTFVSEKNVLVPISTVISTCSSCMDERLNTIQQSANLLQQHEPLVGLELFAGAGGLGTGMDLSGWVKTKYAVEISQPAATSYNFNHPNTHIYCQDVNKLLQFIIERDQGDNPRYLPSDIGGLCTSLPKRGDVDFIYGGAPCQSFSGINHNRKADDIRSTLVCNMLSWVEHYQPAYFLLENVTGLLSYRLLAQQIGKNKFKGGIEMGVVKFVQRTLIALGYQVRHKVLEAAQYGAPQGRQRVIFLGARRGTLIPEFPVPTHCFPRAGRSWKQPIGHALHPATRSKDPDLNHCFAPMNPVTVEDAIGDLPPFDWENPHKIIPASTDDRKEAKYRSSTLGIPHFSAVRGGQWAGYVDPVSYPYLPMNRYQKWLRSSAIGVKRLDTDKVTLHYTALFGARIVERTVNIPMKPRADHRSLPKRLALNKTKTKLTNKFYGRLDANGYFRTAMTRMDPGVKDTYPLHPSQKRILTVRECARVQGFPDAYDLRSTGTTSSAIVKDQHRQIGNAVPVPLALALGKALGDALVKTWLQQEREGSPAV